MLFLHIVFRVPRGVVRGRQQPGVQSKGHIQSFVANHAKLVGIGVDIHSKIGARQFDVRIGAQGNKTMLLGIHFVHLR